MAADSSVSLIDPSLPDFFESLRARDIKIGLNTGYPPRLQYALLSKLHMHEMIDGFVSAKEVAMGRPSPYMVHRLMEQTGVLDCKAVAKFGDTKRDMEEGTNAGCGQVVGVLSGADSRDVLEASGATGKWSRAFGVNLSPET